jgi:hypothetical protein
MRASSLHLRPRSHLERGDLRYLLHGSTGITQPTWLLPPVAAAPPFPTRLAPRKLAAVAAASTVRQLSPVPFSRTELETSGKGDRKKLFVRRHRVGHTLGTVGEPNPIRRRCRSSPQVPAAHGVHSAGRGIEVAAAGSRRSLFLLRTSPGRKCAARASHRRRRSRRRQFGLLVLGLASGRVERSGQHLG